MIIPVYILATVLRIPFSDIPNLKEVAILNSGRALAGLIGWSDWLCFGLTFYFYISIANYTNHAI